MKLALFALLAPMLTFAGEPTYEFILVHESDTVVNCSSPSGKLIEEFREKGDDLVLRVSLVKIQSEWFSTGEYQVSFHSREEIESQEDLKVTYKDYIEDRDVTVTATRKTFSATARVVAGAKRMNSDWLICTELVAQDGTFKFFRFDADPIFP